MTDTKNSPAANDESSPHAWQPPKRSFSGKFADAFLGLRQGTKSQSSFLIHFPVAIVVLVLAAVWSVPLEHWCLLLMCIGLVLGAELFNSSLERISRSVTRDFDPDIEQALNIASAAVLTISITSALVGSLIFLHAILQVSSPV